MFSVVNSIIPVFVVISLGYAAGKATELDVKTLSSVTFYVFSPSLVFYALMRSSIALVGAMQLVLFLLFFTAIISFLSKGAARVLRYSKQRESALLLSTVFPNTVNFGAPLILFSLGESAFDVAIVFGIMEGVMLYWLGIFYASLGRTEWKTSLRRIFHYPLIYAALLGVLINFSALLIDETSVRPIKILADAAIPLILFILGIHLSRISVKRAVGGFITLAAIIRLAVSPLIALLLIYLLGVQGLTGEVLLLQSAMPPAIIATLFAAEFNVHPDLTSANTVITTILSLGTLSTLLVFVA